MPYLMIKVLTMLTKDIFSFEQLGPNIQFKPTKYLNPNVLKVGSVTIYGP